MFQVWLAANAVPLPEASLRYTRLPMDGRVRGARPPIRMPVAEAVRLFAATVRESRPWRSRIAAAPQSTAGGAQRVVWCTWFLTRTFRDEPQRLMPHPEFPVTWLSAR